MFCQKNMSENSTHSHHKDSVNGANTSKYLSTHFVIAMALYLYRRQALCYCWVATRVIHIRVNSLVVLLVNIARNTWRMQLHKAFVRSTCKNTAHAFSCFILISSSERVSFCTWKMLCLMNVAA